MPTEADERAVARRVRRMMRAVVVTAAGGPEVLVHQDRPMPEPGVGQIRVRVHASALNRADLLQRRGRYPSPPGAPADVSGLEYAGEVHAAGPDASLWPAGSRVMGIVGGGGHAEYVCVHEREAIRLPDELTWEQGAAIPEVFLTAYDALFLQLGLGVGQRVLIHAVGSGVGTAALQLAAAAGATTIGTSRSTAKLERARALGLHIAIDASGGRWADEVQAATGGAGVHAVLDLVGGAYFADSLRVMAPRGKLIVVGLTAGSRSEIDLGTVLGRRLHIMGTVLRSRALEEKIALARAFSDAVLPMFEARRIHPVIDRVYPFEEVREAHRYLESNESFGKVVLRWGAGAADRTGDSRK